jgi:ankyrin repeat protein
MTPLHESILDGDAEAVREVVRLHPELVDRDDGGPTPLFMACELGNVDVASILLDGGANPNLAGDDGETPLHVAAFESNLDCARLLIDRKANVRAKTDEGKTVLMNAAQAGSVPIVDRLIEAGADAAVADAMGRTALHWAACGEHDDPSVFDRLVKAGADVNARNANEDTVFDYVRTMKKVAMNRYLSRAGR